MNFVVSNSLQLITEDQSVGERSSKYYLVAGK